MTILSENIVTIRGKLSQEEFGKIIGANKGKVYSYEKKESASKPKQPTLQRIADYAGVTIDDLLNKRLRQNDLTFQSDRDINLNGTEEQIVGETKENLVALTASVKILVSEIKVLVSLVKNEDQTEVSLRIDRLIAKEGKRLLAELRNE